MYTYMFNCNNNTREVRETMSMNFLFRKVLAPKYSVNTLEWVSVTVSPEKLIIRKPQLVDIYNLGDSFTVPLSGAALPTAINWTNIKFNV